MSTNQEYKIITDQIVEQLKKGVVPWHKPWSSTLPLNAVSNKYYNGVNVLLLAMQGRLSPYWLTYKQCTELGGHVEKGETSTIITFWRVSDRMVKDETGKEENKKSFILRYYRVFNIEQTTLKDDERFKVHANNHDPINECEEIINGYVDGPEMNYNGHKASYSPALDRVQIPHITKFENVNEYYSVLFHEMTHSTGHKNRLNRKFGAGFGSESYSKEELIAELGACYLCGNVGIEQHIIGNSTSYIKSWLSALENDDKLLIQAAANAEKAVKHIRGS